MKRYRGTEAVEPGLYFNLRQLSFRSIDEKGPLPGTREDVYRRVPVLVLVLVGPLLGLAYAVFLPLIGLVMVTWLLMVKLALVASVTVRQAVRVVRPGWEPAMAFLSRSKATKVTPAETDEWAEEARKKLGKTDRGAA